MSLEAFSLNTYTYGQTHHAGDTLGDNPSECLLEVMPSYTMWLHDQAGSLTMETTAGGAWRRGPSLTLKAEEVS